MAGKPGQRILTPAQMRDSATPPDELPPQGQVTPQLSFPLGKKTEPSSPLVRPARPANPAVAASASGVGDAVARCEAQASEPARASCRAKLAREETVRR